MAIRSFRHKGLEKLFTAGTKAGIRPEHEARLRRVLAQLAVIETPAGMDLPGYRLHPLRGDQAGRWSVTISGNWRVTFGIEEKQVTEVDYEDYH